MHVTDGSMRGREQKRVNERKSEMIEREEEEEEGRGSGMKERGRERQKREIGRERKRKRMKEEVKEMKREREKAQECTPSGCLTRAVLGRTQVRGRW